MIRVDDNVYTLLFVFSLVVNAAMDSTSALTVRDCCGISCPFSDG